MNKLQESVDFFSAKFGEFDEEKKQKTKQKQQKTKNLEDKNLKIFSKIIISAKQIDKQEQHSRRNCNEVADDIAVKKICKNIYDNIITVDDINRSHRIYKYDSQKKNLRLLIVKLARYNVRDRAFSKQYKIKDKQKKYNSSLTKIIW